MPTVDPRLEAVTAQLRATRRTLAEGEIGAALEEHVPEWPAIARRGVATQLLEQVDLDVDRPTLGGHRTLAEGVASWLASAEGREHVATWRAAPAQSRAEGAEDRSVPAPRDANGNVDWRALRERIDPRKFW